VARNARKESAADILSLDRDAGRDTRERVRARVVSHSRDVTYACFQRNSICAIFSMPVSEVPFHVLNARARGRLQFFGQL